MLKTSLETEVFIHGGVGGVGPATHTSGPGGQPRPRRPAPNPIEFKMGERHFALSLKDMCHIEYIKELEKAGVCSFKIEGHETSRICRGGGERLHRGEKRAKPDLDTLRKVFSEAALQTDI